VGNRKVAVYDNVATGKRIRIPGSVQLAVGQPHERPQLSMRDTGSFSRCQRVDPRMNALAAVGVLMFCGECAAESLPSVRGVE
jgi:hypothetical protein